MVTDDEAVDAAYARLTEKARSPQIWEVSEVARERTAQALTDLVASGAVVHTVQFDGPCCLIVWWHW